MGRMACAMSLWVACIACRETFSADLHPGLVRCAPCTDRSAWRLPAAPRTAVEVEA